MPRLFLCGYAIRKDIRCDIRRFKERIAYDVPVMIHSVDVIVTAYRKEATINSCLSRLLTSLDAINIDFRIYVADDASDDDTVYQARSIKDERIVVLTSETNIGKGAQIRKVLQLSDASIVAIFDGDMDIHPKSLVDGITTLIQTGVDGVVGSKSHPQSVVRYPASRKILSRMFRFLSKLLFGLYVRDTQTGVKVFRGDMFRDIGLVTRESGFVFDLELLARMARSKRKIVEIPVQISFDFTSTITPSAMLRMLADMWRVHRTLR